MPRRKKSAAPQAEHSPERREAEVDRDIAEDFQQRQDMSEEGRDELARKLREHNSLSPEISAGDVDAAWDAARASGEETFTGHAPTPDQDRVDDMGAAAGLTYKDDEPLGFGKVARRDERRWELDARSGRDEQTLDETADEDEEDDEDEDDSADADDAPLRFWDLADDLDAEVEGEADEEDEESEDDDLAARDEADESDEAEADDDLDSDEEADELDDDLDELDEIDADEDDDEDDDD